MRERERQRRRAAHDLARLVVLRAVAGAHELVRGLVPRHDAAQVRADGVDAVVADLLVVVDNQVGRVALEALDELSAPDLVRVEPALERHLVAGLGQGGQAAAAAAAAARDEEEEVRDGQAADRR